jgi:diaminopimelate decarboxylase
VSTEAGARHAPNRYFPVRDNCLWIGDRPLTEVAAQVGRTPFYVYERRAMSARVQELRRLLPATVKLHYAMKANPMPAVVQHMVGLVDGIDVASAGELEIALAAGADPAKISFAGPGKQAVELERAATAGIVVNLESEREMQALAAIGRRGARPRVAIRVNPDFELKTSGMKMSGGPKPFGIDAERVPQVLRELAGLPLEFCGFHIFSGSQNLRADAIIDAQQKAVALACELAREAPAPVRLLNIGGGFGIPYVAGEQPLDLEPIARNLKELLAHVAQVLPSAELVLELGRYLVGEAGLYVCRVLDRKVSRGQVFLITDGGLHHHLAASGNFGQVLRRNYPVMIANRAAEAVSENASVVGCLCTPLDILADRMPLPRGEPGDLVVVFQSGAYGRSASPLGFLTHPHPPEVLL